MKIDLKEMKKRRMYKGSRRSQGLCVPGAKKVVFA